MLRARPFPRLIRRALFVWMGIGVFVSSVDLAAAPADSLSLDYRRGLNTDIWTGGLTYNKVLRPGLFLSVHETLNSSRLQVRADQNKWKDQHNLLFTLRRTLHPSVDLVVRGSSYLFTDYQSGYVNDSRTHRISAGSEIRWKRMHFPLGIGIQEDRRYHRRDLGWTWSGGMRFNDVKWADYFNSLSADAETDYLGRRRNQSIRLEYDVARRFDIDTYDSLRVVYGKNRRDYYISDLGDVESRDEQVRGVENVLWYRFSSAMRFAFEGRLTSRQLKINLISGSASGLKRERRDLRTQGNARLVWKTAALSGDVLFGYTGEDQQYRLGESAPGSPYSGSSMLFTPDNRGLTTTLSLRNRFTAGRSDTLTLMASVQRFRYDTPDPENTDDRDEMRIRSELSLHHFFSPRLSASVALQLHLLHFVYIFSDRSADNNWTRILRLCSKTDWHPVPTVHWIQSAEVLANYVDYDFDDLIPGIRSFLYRKVQLDDTLHVRISGKTSMLLSYRLELDENGKLLWKDWREQRLTDRRSHTVNFALTYRMWGRILLMPGYSLYHRAGYRYEADSEGGAVRDQNVNFKSHGPIMRFTYQGDRLAFGLSGSTVLTRSIGIVDQLLTRIDMHLRWAL